jgi:hypothetical protein
MKKVVAHITGTVARTEREPGDAASANDVGVVLEAVSEGNVRAVLE